MSTWILVALLYSGFNASTAVVLPGFESYEACVEASKAVRELCNCGMAYKATCIEQRKPK